MTAARWTAGCASTVLKIGNSVTMSDMSLESSPTASRRTGRRVGDAQRAGCADKLADAFVGGELSQAEFDDRTELCLSAVTDVDLARLTSDLSPRTPSLPVQARGSATGTGQLPRFISIELALLLVAYALGVELETEFRSWLLITLQIWLFGSVANVAGAFLLRPAHRP